jgi:hypothetical protein
MKWCCPTFEGWFNEAGNRGLAVVVDQTATAAPLFLLQHRSVDVDDEGPKHHPHPLTLVSQVGILFCPWCGANLAAFYNNDFQAMERLAYKMRR